MIKCGVFDVFIYEYQNTYMYSDNVLILNLNDVQVGKYNRGDAPPVAQLNALEDNQLAVGQLPH